MADHAFDTLTRPMPHSPVLALLLGDIVRLKRTHPCGSREWTVTRIGADIGLQCVGCGRRVMLERRQVERRFKSFVHRAEGTPPA